MLIDRAIRRYVKEETRATLRKQLTERYDAGAPIDSHLAKDWFPLEEEASRHLIARQRAKRFRNV